MLQYRLLKEDSQARKTRSGLQPGLLKTAAQLQAWRVAQGLTAKRVGDLLELTERTIHRAERGAQLGSVLGSV